MRNLLWIAAAYSVALLGIGYLVSRLVRRPAKKEHAPPKADQWLSRCPMDEEPEVVVMETAAPPPPPPGPKIEVCEAPIAGSELRFYKPFGPGDGIFDMWEKLQAFTSSEPILVRLTPADDTAPIVRSTFPPDGTLRSPREMFFEELAKNIRTAGPSAWRAVRRLSSFGIPECTPEASYHFSTSTLRMELKGVEVLGITFAIRATFEPNLGLIPRYFSQSSEYFHCEMASGDSPRGKAAGELVTVGFPWSLTTITLYSEDRSLEHDGSRITKAIIEKYAKYLKQDQALVPTPADPTRRISVISDGVVAITIHEGTYQTKISQGRSLQIEYSPFPHGPLDVHAAGDTGFLMFAKSMAEERKPDLVEEELLALETPF